MTEYRYVIVGGGLAGQRAAQGIRDADADGPVALLTAEPHLPYERPPLSKGYLMGEAGLDAVIIKGEEWYEENAIELMTGTRVVGVDSVAHRLALENGARLSYGKLLLATGGHAWRLPLPGADLENVFTLRTIEDSDAIQAAAEGADGALVLGGSFIGSEVTASLTQMGVNVTMVFPESRLLERIVPQRFSAFLQDVFEGEGVRILPGRKPERLEGDGGVERAVLDSGETLQADVVVMGVGIRLNTELAEDAGLEMTDRGAVIVDEYLRTSDPAIYAAGDIAAWPDRTFDTRLRVEHWDVARRQGLRAGRNMAGDEKPYASVPYFFSDMFDLSFEVWGNLDAWDETVLRGELGSSSFMLFYFNQGIVVGILSVGRLGDARKVIPGLVKARLAYEEVGEKMAAESVELSTLIE